jgi:hypothetical protein
LGFIPSDARWYLADVVLEHRVEGDPRNVVHVNTHLVEAGSPEHAYEKAMALGRSAEHAYENTDGRPVLVIFRGLRELGAVHEPLEDGAELMFTEDVGVPEERLLAWAKPKEGLAVFAPAEVFRGTPNYLPVEFWPLVQERAPREGDGAADA